MEYVYCFLKGLNNNYQNICTHIFLLGPIPNISRVYSLIAQQEVALPLTPASTILFANNPNSFSHGRGRSNSKSPMLCTNYNKTNHTVDTFYFKHGFPPEYRTRNSKSSLDSKKPNNLKIHGDISKRDYRHFLLLLQQSKKYSQASNIGKHPTVDTRVI